MLFKSMDTRMSPLFSSLNVLNIDDLFKLEIAKHVHKFSTTSLPDIFHEQYTLQSHVHQRTIRTRSTTRSDIVVKRTKKCIGKKTSTVLGATIWNEIPESIRKHGLKSFAKAYKESLIEQYA